MFGSRLHFLRFPHFPEAQFAMSAQPDATFVGEDNVLELFVFFCAFRRELQPLYPVRLPHNLTISRARFSPPKFKSDPLDGTSRKVHLELPQPAPAPVVPEVSIHVPVEATPPTFSPAAESVQAQSEMIGSVGLLTTDKLVALKLNAKSRANFAVLLLKELFNPKELEGKNIAGVRGKEMVDPERITEIKKMLQRFYPVPAAHEESCWRMCRKAMDEFLRRPSWHRKRAE